ncbi:histidine kinase [Zunongwangia sp. SCSIO 43204]|nr:histidine kinase [Zunongwangia sp. SCSIO 43204]
MERENFNCTDRFFLKSKKIVYVFIISILCGVYSTAQQLNPPIQSYSSIEYDAASQNWDVSIDDLGVIYVANNRGLLVYNGQTWKLYSLNSGAIIRSVYTFKDKIFTGSYREFGYWSRSDKGNFKYHSLKSLFKDINLSDEEFWGIIAYKENIYFRSFGGLYKYDGESIDKIASGVFTSMQHFKGKLLVAKGQDGLFYLDNNDKLKFYQPSVYLKGTTIADIELHNQQLYVGSREKIYSLNTQNNQFELLPEKVNQFIGKSELNKIISLPNNDLMIGTLKSGLLKWNSQNGNYQIFDRSNGLQNNTILSMDYFKGNLWLGLDNGIDRIDIDSPISFYTDTSGELGAVYDLVNDSDQMFLASNTGVYRLADDKLKIIEGAEGHSWNLEKLESEILSNSNSGTLKINSENAEIIDNSTGSFYTEVSPSGKYLIGTYTGIITYTDDHFSKIDSLNFPVQKIIFENENTLWAAHPYEGVYRVILFDSLGIAESVKEVSGLKNASLVNPQIFKINNQIAVFSDDRWLKYNAFSDSLEDFEEINKFNGYKLLEEINDEYWFINTKTNDLLFTNLKEKQLILPSWRLDNRLVKGYEQMTAVSDSVFYISLKDGFARLDLSKLLKEQAGLFISEPFVTGLEDLENKYALTEEAEIPFKNASLIRFDIGLPFSDAREIGYHLIGNDTISGIVDNGKLEFQNLDYGEYDLALYPLGSRSDNSKVFSFSILPPWYLSLWMKSAYLMLFLCGIALIFLYNRRRLKKHQLLIEQKFEKEHKERIDRLERERLMDEIDMKRKELANTTMMAAKKNEVLMEIQGELNKDKAKINQYRLKHIMNKINGAVKSKDEWQVFETNFNEIHEDFFKDLLDTYPQLTSKDLKLCSYLKMNLTSKEIAPLMGISVRGVEVHRYRLRKKMDLDKNENLTNFLIKNF